MYSIASASWFVPSQYASLLGAYSLKRHLQLFGVGRVLVGLLWLDASIHYQFDQTVGEGLHSFFGASSDKVGNFGFAAFAYQFSCLGVDDKYFDGRDSVCVFFDAGQQDLAYDCSQGQAQRLPGKVAFDLWEEVDGRWMVWAALEAWIVPKTR